MKIAFLSQMGFTGKIPRNHPNMRTEFAQMCALEADHYSLYDVDKITEEYDHLVLLIPKTQQDRDGLYNIDIVQKARRVGKKVWFMQEGPNWIFQDLPIHQQFWHYNVLMDVDGILTENKTDISYYRGLVGGDKPIYDIPSLMITDLISELPTLDRSGVIVGGNFGRWYNGFMSYLCADKFKEKIYFPTMGRKMNREEEISDIIHLPYMNWVEWIRKLNEFKYAIHLMPTVAAGTFSLNCAYLKIPCISNEKIDTQRICYPELSVDIDDLEDVNKLVIRLRDDIDFYNDCANNGYENYMKNYSEEIFIKKMEKNLNSF